jgi:hypothetical protein
MTDRYPWLEPSSVKSDGKYRVTADGQIRLIFTLNREERALLTTDKHEDLVSRVAAVKKRHGDQPSGVFYINEWRHVLVKAGGGTWYAGRYEPLLEFDFDGQDISARAPAQLEPGDRWDGPRVGIKYTMTADGDDIYCKRMVRPQVERTERLSAYLGGSDQIVRSWSRHKPRGGGVYINEARELFAPVNEGWIYLGRAGAHEWFPEPSVDDA